jgi:hypothetical protein
MVTEILLIVYTVGFPVQILETYRVDMASQTLFITFVIYFISSYTSSIIVVFWVSIIKRKRFLGINENISEVDNKVICTLQNETHMNRNVMFNIF